MLCESGLCHSFLKPSKPITASDYIDKWVPQMRSLAPIQANAVESKTSTPRKWLKMYCKQTLQGIVRPSKSESREIRGFPSDRSVRRIAKTELGLKP
ncbi:hypothetical protein TNCV_285701 [Trichonephila clavipes]|nr:hypothetical protein TNCV_285701 [Trichonephila clavipes]